MPVKMYGLQGGMWQPLDGVGGPVAPGSVNTPPDPEDPADWRARPLMLPNTGKTAFGFSPTVGTLAQLEGIWGAPSRLVRIYGGTLLSLAGTMSTCQNALNTGRIPVLDFNTSAQYANCGWVVDSIDGAGKSLWQAQSEGFFDADGVGPSGLAYKGFNSMWNAIGALDRGTCPTNRIMLSKDHEMEDMNEGGGDGKVNGGAVNKSSGTEAEFRAAWQHFVARGVATGNRDNALLFMDGASGVGRWGESMTDTGSDGFYPGHAHVDFVAWDPYNSAGVRDKDKWRNFNESASSGMLNKFGQLTWWRRNFKVGGKATLAQVVGSEGIYKPAMLAEFGTTDSFTEPGDGSFHTAVEFANSITTYLAANPDVFPWLLYYNNSINDIRAGYRLTGFTNKGLNAVFV